MARALIHIEPAPGGGYAARARCSRHRVTRATAPTPEAGTVFEQDGVRFTVLAAEPQKVNRVKIEVIPQPAEEPVSTAPTGI